MNDAISRKTNPKSDFPDQNTEALPSIGFIGVGLMGHGVAGNLINAGYELTVMAHRNRKPVDDLIERGARETSSPQAMALQCDVIFLCVTSSVQVEELVYGIDGLLTGTRKGLTVVDCTTADPRSTLKLAATFKQHGIHFVDAPLGRTPRAAEQGQLNAYVGGDEATVARLTPLLDTFTENVFHLGPVGSGHKMKLLTQLISMSYAALYAEAYAACEKTGTDPVAFFEIIDSGGLTSGFFQNFSKWVLHKDPQAHAFSISNCAKDIGYYNAMVDDANMVSIIGPATKQSFAVAMAQGAGDLYMPRLADALKQLNGVAAD